MSKYDLLVDEMLKLRKEGLNNSEIGKVLGIDGRRVSERLKKIGAEPLEIKFKKPNEMQKEVLLGTVIGDGCIFKSKNSKNARLNLAHSLKQEKYFLMKYDILKDFIDVNWKYKSQIHSVVNKKYNCIMFQSKVNPYLTELHEKFYEKGKKVIKKGSLDDMTLFSLAIKYFDDGFNQKSGYCISMNDFDIESIEELIKAIKRLTGAICTIHKAGVIYIPKEYKAKFKELILPFATEDVKYKL